MLMYLSDKAKMSFLKWEDVLTDKEKVLLEAFFVMNEYKYNPGNIEKIWYEDELLCVQYQDNVWWHYDIVRAEWW